MGVLGLGAAFAAVAGGVFVSLQRDRLLAWLERDDPEEAPAPRPASVLGETVPAAVVAVGLALVAALWFGPRVAKAEALRDAASFAAQARPPRAIGHRGR